MTTFQRTVKFLAMLLAIALIAAIFTGFGGAIIGISHIFGGSDSISEITNDEGYTTETFKQEDIEKLDIELAAATIQITDGDTFSVQYSKQGARVQHKKNTLKIEEKGIGIIGFERDSVIIVTIPSDMNVKNVDIESGAGAVNIDKLVCEKFELEFGAGEVTLGDVEFKSKAQFDCGVGKLTVKNGIMNNLEFSSGVGDCNINAYLTGKANFEAGVGKVALSLLGEKQDYTVSAETGVGIISVDGQRLSDGDIFGDGENKVYIEGGVGAVKVSFP